VLRQPARGTSDQPSRVLSYLQPYGCMIAHRPNPIGRAISTIRAIHRADCVSLMVRGSMRSPTSSDEVPLNPRLWQIPQSALPKGRG